jgi:D-glycero-D-manno-heptose 1,7-bisphosphate phosphatase
LLPGIRELYQAAKNRGLAVVEVTNQAGIGRAYFDWAEYLRVENRMNELLGAVGVWIDAVFSCPFHPEGVSPYRVDNHPWRKPNPGMLLEAARLLNLELRESLIVGDKASDLLAGQRAGLALGIHVLTGHGYREQDLSRAAAAGHYLPHILPGLEEAARLLEELPPPSQAVLRVLP